MNLIKKITDSDFFGGSNEYLDQVSRYAARGVLVNQNLKICLIYLKAKDIYKLPGGGIKESESSEEAFLREILEETGHRAEIISNPGYIEEHKVKNDFLQRSYCYIAKAKNGSGKRELTAKEKDNQLKFFWTNFWQALNYLNESVNKCNNYRDKFMVYRDKVILEESLKNLKFRIKKATLDDIDILGQIHARSWQHAYKNIIPDSVLADITAQKRADRFKKAMSESGEENYLLLVNNQPVGFTSIGISRDDDLSDNTGEIWGIYLDPDHWRKGYGSKLLNWAEAELKSRGYKSIALWVLKDNHQARKFYKKHNFHKEGRRETITIGNKDLEKIRYIKT